MLGAAGAGGVLAKSCDEEGQLRYIGRTSNGGNSVWFSRTSAGGFALDAASGGVRVDQWTLAAPGGHLSLSPFVSNGNGGTHKLYGTGSGSDCLLDTQNQKDGLVFPALPPSFGKPPVGITPGLPIGVRPPIGTLPPPVGITPQLPGGVTPPIGTLPPPVGITPQLPGGVTPPIGTLPPTGITPELPGGVTPPIGTLPPTGITPELPGGVTPPIGTLPPTGITPELPGGVTPPIGTLPPTGITPELPGGVTPPIGTLPPTGITPELPGGVTPPIGTLPPEGITPQVPGGVTPPIGTLPPVTAPQIPSEPTQPGLLASASVPTGGGAAHCANPELLASTLYLCDLDLLAPDAAWQNFITPGRAYSTPTPWNLWTSYDGLAITDDSDGAARNFDASRVTVGLDYALRPDLIVGMQVESRAETGEEFGGMATKTSEVLSAGPYFSDMVNENWTVSGLLTLGTVQNQVDILTLSGSYDQVETHANLTATGRYDRKTYYWQPQVSLDHLNRSSESYHLQGVVEGQDLDVIADVPETSGTALSANVEIGSLFLDQGTLISPYGQFGVSYSVANLGSDDGQETAFSGEMRAGLRVRWSNALYLDASIGYLSLFEDGVDAIDVGLQLSSSF